MTHSYRMTIPDLLQYLHQQVVTSLAKQDEQTLGNLSAMLMELSEAAQHYGDMELYEVLDDLTYPVNETLMGAPGKGAGVLDEVPAKIAKLAATRTQS